MVVMGKAAALPRIAAAPLAASRLLLGEGAAHPGHYMMVGAAGLIPRMQLQKEHMLGRAPRHRGGQQA